MSLSTTTTGHPPADITTAVENSSIYQLLLDRCRSLEASYANLQEQFHVFEQEHMTSSKSRYSEEESRSAGELMSYSGFITNPNTLPFGFSYKRVLDYLGHALFVTKAVSQEIVYWNCSAEKLFGYEKYEVLGRRFMELLIYDEFHLSAKKIMGKLRSGQLWAGQFPFKKKSGEIFMALVNKSPLYEDGELVGVITVASDATVFNRVNSENATGYQDPPNGRTRMRGLHFKNIQWHPLQQVSSFVANLAQKDGHETDYMSGDMERSIQEPPHVNSEKPPKAPPVKRGFGFSMFKRTTGADGGEDGFAQSSKLAVKFLSKLHIQRNGNMQQEGSSRISENYDAVDVPYCQKNSATAIPLSVLYPEYEREISEKAYSPFDLERDANPNGQIRPYVINDAVSSEAVKGEGNGFSEVVKPVQQLAILSSPFNRREFEVENQLEVIADCEIRWEDLIFKEEIGHGSFALVYRGIWNGSDVAVKVFFGNQYSEESLDVYKKEIDIMKRLRHPNVLLFMGAVCSWEKVAIVTEFLPRGSLFKILHKKGSPLDLRRRLTMAVDVARGVNYLHHRHPPIVHRDLKSSNLLVDKNWSVKVGDFGLSKLNHATFLTARSGRGTPQWMAPEVLRNEPSNEKSDVFSFGVILWELVTLCIPWDSLDPLEVVGVVGFMDRRLDLPKDLDFSLSTIIQDCWQSNPALRPSFEKIIPRMTDLIQTLPSQGNSKA